MDDFSDPDFGQDYIEGSHGSLDIELSEDGAEILAEIAVRFFPQTAPVAYIHDELEAQDHLLRQEFHKAVIIRQATFFENILASQLKEKLEQQKGEELSSQEEKLADELGYAKLLDLGFILDVYDENERRQFQELFGARHRIAHQPWTSFSEDDQRTFRNVSNQLHERLGELLYSLMEDSELWNENELDL